MYPLFFWHYAFDPLKWKDILFDEGKIAVGRQTFVHTDIQAGGKTEASENIRSSRHKKL